MTESGSITKNYRASTVRKTIVLVVSIIGVVLIAGLLSVKVCQNISLTDVYRLIWEHINGVQHEMGSADWWNDRHVWNRSVPRVLAAILAGAGLAAAGVMMQSLMNNPLADPYSTGISSGAAFGATSAIVMAASFSAVYNESTTVVFAFIGAMVPALIIILISSKIQVTPATLILLGTAISYFFNSMITYMMVTTDADSLQHAYSWQIGGLDSIGWESIPIMAAITVVGCILVLLLSRKLNLLMLGDASAKTLGLNVETFRVICLTLMAIMTAGIVSFTGILGFIGLVTPHIVRFLVGADNRFVTPIAMAMAAFLTLVCDYFAVTVFDTQLGAVLALFGSPIFLLLIIRQKRGREIY